MNLRKLNLVLSLVICILLALHGIAGAFMLLKVSTITIKPLAYALLAAVGIHAVLGIVFTKEAVTAGAKSGKWYVGLNAGFWVKRITGVVILLLLAFHLTAWTGSYNGIFFLKEFTPARFVSQLVFVLAIFVHLFASVRPLLIKAGLLAFKERTIDVWVVLSILLLFFTTALVVYFISWQLR